MNKGRIVSRAVGLILFCLTLTAGAVAQNLNPESPVRARGSGIVQVCNNGFAFCTGEEGHFSFRLERLELGGPVTGKFYYYDSVTGETVQGTITTVALLDANSLSFGGPCTVDGAPGQCSAYTTDNGEPGHFDEYIFQFPSKSGFGLGQGTPILSGSVEVNLIQ